MQSKLNKLIRLPEKIPCDKRLHALVGVVLIAILSIFTLTWYIIFGILVFVAWGIEFYQKFTKSGTYDNWDAIAVVIGGLIVYVSRLLG